MNAEPLLVTKGVGKSFGLVRALRGVSLEFYAGEVHSVIGENGAGKSTLMKILVGMEEADEGCVEGAGVGGVAMIHQELSGVADLSVAANIFLGRERTHWGVLDRAWMSREAERWLGTLGGGISPEARLGDLSIAQQQRVEIAKALSQEARVLILDEPTAVLPADDCERLFALLGQLRERGVALIFISHHLDEVVRMSDRISVLRDGAVTATLGPFGLGNVRPSETELAERMVGREMGTYFPERGTVSREGEPALRVEDWTTADVASVSLEVWPGEIVGLAGLIGSGRTEFAESLFGLRPGRGRITLMGKGYEPRSALEALRSGLVYLPEDRKGAGLAVECSVRENMTLAALRDFGKGALDLAREREVVATEIESLGIRTASMEAPVASLSGGNQQKVLVAKWLLTRPRVLVIDEPTRGVDIGAKQEIYALLHKLALEGVAIVLISSELNEVLGLCHRIAVFQKGHIAGVLEGADVSDRDVMRLAAV